jgi:hypothetical protein
MLSNFLFLASLVLAATRHSRSSDYFVPPVELAEAPYADWAHKHWVREDFLLSYVFQ